MTMKVIPPVILLSMIVGCASAPSPQAEATSHVKPIIAALHAYHRESGDYPQQLDELRPHYLRAGVPLYDNRDAKPWALIYQRVNRTSYKLYVDSTPCSQAVFKDGTFIAGYGPNFN
jgi:hypothetical protein